MNAEIKTAARERGGQNDSGNEPELNIYLLRPRLGVARRHPFYHRILRGALSLLRSYLKAIAPEYTLDEICRRENGRVLRNTFGSAVVQARDALGIRRHGIANHIATVRELKRMCCGGKYQRRAAHREVN